MTVSVIADEPSRTALGLYGIRSLGINAVTLVEHSVSSRSSYCFCVARLMTLKPVHVFPDAIQFPLTSGWIESPGYFHAVDDSAKL
jgi:hypothetical protein